MECTGAKSRFGVDRFEPGPWAWAALMRIMIAMIGCACMLKGQLIYGGSLLVLCVWCDAVSGMIGRRRAWLKSSSDIQVEGFADALCFVVTPAVMVAVAVNYSSCAMLALPVFVLAGIWRLARFNVEGLVGRGYVGLPVTYNGYLIPLSVCVAHYCVWLPIAVWYALCLVGISWFMVSRRFVTPEL